MKLTYVALLILVSAVLFAQPRRAYVPGRLIVGERTGADPQSVARALQTNGTITLHRNPQLRHHVLQLPDERIDSTIRSLEETGLFTFVERDGVATVFTVPNDPQFGSQWHLAAIQAASAWNTTVGNSTPIAVIDSGVDLTHPDLASRITAGWNFLNGNSNTQDTMGHGTATAGTIGAATNNLTGVAGVTWSNPIMPLVVVDSTGSAAYSNIASAIQYAADHGARIINISIGGTSPSSAIQSAVNYAWDKGSVVFASAGNGGGSAPYYPAGCTSVVAVSATEPNGTLSAFSNYGTWVDLSAPGDSILTLVYGGGYGYWAGTSFSSPIAAGVGALALAARPSLTASALVSLLEANSDGLGAAGFDPSFGYGQVDAYKAVSAALSTPVNPPPAVTISTPTTGSNVSGTVSVKGAASDALGISSVRLYCDDLLVASGPSASFSFSWSVGSMTGSHTLSVVATDPSGNSGTASVVVSVVAPPPPTPDTVPPTLRITSPANGITVTNGNLAVSAAAQDNVGVKEVCLYIDNVQQYCGLSASYSFNWNIRKAASGTHLITAKAWDAAGNVGTANPVSVTVR